MTRPKDDLIQQLDRLPLNRFLRQEVTAGVEALSDAEAQDRAAELAVALDRLPDLLERLRTGNRHESGQAEGFSLPSPERQPAQLTNSGAEAEEGLFSPELNEQEAADRWPEQLTLPWPSFRWQRREGFVSEIGLEPHLLKHRANDSHNELLGILGGALLGSGLSSGLFMLLAKNYSLTGGFITLALAGLGSFCVALVLGRRRQPAIRPMPRVKRRKPNSALFRSVKLPSAFDPAVQGMKASSEGHKEGKAKKAG